MVENNQLVSAMMIYDPVGESREYMTDIRRDFTTNPEYFFSHIRDIITELAERKGVVHFDLVRSGNESGRRGEPYCRESLINLLHMPKGLSWFIRPQSVLHGVVLAHALYSERWNATSFKAGQTIRAHSEPDRFYLITQRFEDGSEMENIGEFDDDSEVAQNIWKANSSGNSRIRCLEEADFESFMDVISR